MTDEIAIGQTMLWRKIVSNYGHVAVARVTVLKIGKRITVEVPKFGGGTRKAIVTRNRLRPAYSVSQP